MLSAEKDEAMRQAGIYLGSVILASVVGNAVYGAAFGTTAINVGGMPPFMSAMFAVGGGAIAWSLTDRLGRIAWSVFSCHHGIQLLAAAWGTRMGSIWSLGLITLFAALVTRSGARNAPRRTLFIAGSVFVVATTAVFCARYYADELLGSHSVIR
jgi:hypothetical protein